MNRVLSILFIVLIVFLIVFSYFFYISRLYDAATVELKLDNFKEAIYLYKKASKLGSVKAKCELAIIYGTGLSSYTGNNFVASDRDIAMQYLSQLDKKNEILTINSIIYGIKHEKYILVNNNDLVFWERRLNELQNKNSF